MKNKKLSKKATSTSDILPGVEPVSHSSNNLELSKEAKVYNAPGPWSKLYKKQLLEVGRKVEKMLQEKDTPNEVKLEGFANILHGVLGFPYYRWQATLVNPCGQRTSLHPLPTSPQFYLDSAFAAIKPALCSSKTC